MSAKKPQVHVIFPEQEKKEKKYIKLFFIQIVAAIMGSSLIHTVRFYLNGEMLSTDLHRDEVSMLLMFVLLVICAVRNTIIAYRKNEDFNLKRTWTSYFNIVVLAQSCIMLVPAVIADVLR